MRNSKNGKFNNMINVSIPLNDVEVRILKELFETDLKSPHRNYYGTQSVIEDCVADGKNEEEAKEALQCLLDRNYLDGMHTLGSSIPPNIRLSDVGFEESCQLFLTDYDDLVARIGRHLDALTDSESASLKKIAADLDQPFLVAYHFVDFYRKLGWVKMHREDSEYAQVVYVSPLLKRALELETSA